MKTLYKLLAPLLIFMIISNCANAKNFDKINKLIKSSPLDNTATISVSIRDAKSGDEKFAYNSKKLLHPASTLKVFTTTAAYNTLGNDYLFKTQFYVDSANNLYIKLGADPMFTSKDLKDMVKELRAQGYKELKAVYFDDSIFDKQEWGTGWMWDDNTNSYMPKFSAYNIDGNSMKIIYAKDDNGKLKATKSANYKTSLVNQITEGKDTKYAITRYDWINPEVTELTGNVSKPCTITIPISNMRKYFIDTLISNFSTYNIKVKEPSYSSKLLPDNLTLIAETTNSIERALPLILKNSNNMYAETLFKAGGSYKTGGTGTLSNSVYMFNDFYNKNQIDTKDIIIADGSGVSRNDLISTEWMTKALYSIYNNSKLFPIIQDNMAQPGDGTLSKRLFDLRGQVWLKTGSNANISGITGYVKDKTGQMYTIAILIQNFKESQNEIKNFEDNLIQNIYD